MAFLYLNHENIRKYEPEARGMFDDVYHMNEDMIAKWNRVVKPGDVVIGGGDFFMGPKAKWHEIPPRLNSWENVLAVRGNHDRDPAPSLFPKGLPDERYFIYKGYKFWLNHFPLGVADYHDRGYVRPEPKLEYDFALAGHTHARAGRYVGKSVCVCIDLNNLELLHMDEVLKLCLENPTR